MLVDAVSECDQDAARDVFVDTIGRITLVTDIIQVFDFSHKDSATL